jgi:hypothetical protein
VDHVSRTAEQQRHLGGMTFLWALSLPMREISQLDASCFQVIVEKAEKSDIPDIDKKK